MLAMHPVKAHPRRYADRVGGRSDQGRLILIYFGSNSDANVDAIEWFIEEVWSPDLAEQFELQIHGGICDSLRISASGVRVCGRSSSIDAVYHDADIAINPQRFGSGLKIKTVEAMGYGVPVLTTSIGAEGLEEVTGRALLCADDAAAMRRQLLRLNNASLRGALSESALDFVSRSLTPEACFGSLRKLIETQCPVNGARGLT